MINLIPVGSGSDLIVPNLCFMRSHPERDAYATLQVRKLDLQVTKAVNVLVCCYKSDREVVVNK